MKQTPMLLVLVTLTAASLLASCGSSNEIITVFVRANKAGCADAGLCLIARAEDDDAYRLIDGIGGFRFRWGYDYELRVELRRKQMLGPSTTTWVLDNVEKDDEVPGGTSFELCLASDTAIEFNFDEHLGWLGQERREFEFSQDLVAQIEAFEQKKFGVASFEFKSDVDDPLVLTGIDVDLEESCEGPIPEYVPDPDPAS